MTDRVPIRGGLPQPLDALGVQRMRREQGRCFTAVFGVISRKSLEYRSAAAGVTIKFLHCGDGMSVGERFRLPGIAALDHGGKGRRQAAGITGQQGQCQLIAGWLADQAGVPRDTAQCGAVTLIQRFGSALNLNVHFHMLWLDGVYDANVEPPRRKPRLRRARAPTSAQLTQLANTIAHRVCRHLTRKGWLEGEGESAFLADSAAGDDSMDGLRMSSITYRIATGRDAGCKVVTLQTLPGDAGSLEGEAGKVGGFSLHAGVAAEAHESHKLEKLCRYITRPAISEKRLSIALQGRVRYQLKTPWRNGTTHVEWDPVDFIAKLAALVPPPRAHLTRFHGVFAPNAALRAQLTPSGRGRRHDAAVEPADASANDAPRSPEEKRRSMSWAQRLKRVFSIDVTACVHCGGTVRIVASIEEPAAIRAILGHFVKQGAREEAHYRPAARAPPVQAA